MKKDEHRTKADLIGELNSLRGEVTRIREAEAGLRDAGALYRTLAESSPVGVYFLVKGRFRFVNTRFEQSTGYRADELSGTQQSRCRTSRVEGWRYGAHHLKDQSGRRLGPR